ncbi:STAS domain-containing protein [uncultured Caulobacter sp.]|uniref:STAS domain-containing protein n=1 Tax=uncultured Caulobacter sp. TaxID=158749 RepID=UPI002630F3B0|nr:STAS domain-containing protein [uncultured Caulobacter sp.]
MKFSDDVTVANIAVAYDRICSVFECDGDVEIDVDELGEADLTFVQLLESARRAAAEEGRRLDLSRPAHGALLQVLQRGGFLDPEDRDRSEFWLHGANSQ